MVQLVDSLNLSTNVEVVNLGVQVLDSGVVRIAAKDQLGFLCPAMVGTDRQPYRVMQTHYTRIPRRRRGDGAMATGIAPLRLWDRTRPY